jgi:hypothetical protein
MVAKEGREQRERRRYVRPDSQAHRDADDYYGDEVHRALEDEDRHRAANDVVRGHVDLA